MGLGRAHGACMAQDWTQSAIWGWLEPQGPRRAEWVPLGPYGAEWDLEHHIGLGGCPWDPMGLNGTLSTI